MNLLKRSLKIDLLKMIQEYLNLEIKVLCHNKINLIIKYLMILKYINFKELKHYIYINMVIWKRKTMRIGKSNFKMNCLIKLIWNCLKLNLNTIQIMLFKVNLCINN